MIKNQEIFTTQLTRLLLSQSGLLPSEEELIPNIKVPTSIGDILRSKKYRDHKVKNLKEK